MHALTLHNSLTRRREVFTPINPQRVGLYVCGPTVYDRAHLGNARPVVVFDVLARLLRVLFPHVLYVRNITDVEDKINARAAELGVSIGEVTARTTAEFHADMAALGTLPPDEEPRATDNIPEMIAIIEKLVANGHAYEAEGHVLFSVASDPHYGRLSGRSPEEMQAGARVEVAPFKRDPGDFVLWKPSPANPAGPELPGWDSPWGRGRPGWHIECSAMSWRYLGEDFDLHGGGSDLLFPHHENEMAQSCCAFPGSHFAHTWVHNGMLLVDGEKMSKSLGNFRTVRDVLEVAPGEAVRFLLLRAHYRATLDFTEAALAEARRELDRFYPRPRPPCAGLRRGAGRGAGIRDGGAVRRPQYAGGHSGAACAGGPCHGGRCRGGGRAACRRARAGPCCRPALRLGSTARKRMPASPQPSSSASPPEGTGLRARRCDPGGVARPWDRARG